MRFIKFRASPGGEMKNVPPLYQNQIAKTIATLLGLHYTNDSKVGDGIISTSKGQ